MCRRRRWAQRCSPRRWRCLVGRPTMDVFQISLHAPDIKGMTAPTFTGGPGAACGTAAVGCAGDAAGLRAWGRVRLRGGDRRMRRREDLATMSAPPADGEVLALVGLSWVRRGWPCGSWRWRARRPPMSSRASDAASRTIPARIRCPDWIAWPPRPVPRPGRA